MSEQNNFTPTFLNMMLVFGALVVANLLAGLGFWLLRRSRDRELAVWASRARFAYEEDGEELLLEPFGALPLFRDRTNPRISSVISGVWNGLDLRFFVFRYRNSGRRRPHTVEQTVAVVRVADASLPQFSLRPRHWSMFLLPGRPSIVSFPDEKAFEDVYVLEGVDEAAARNLFRGELTRYLAARPGWGIEGIGEWVVCYRWGDRCSPKRLRPFLEQVRAFHNVFSGGSPAK